jgi:hypothetical protein
VVTVDCHSTRTSTCEPCGLDYRDRVRRIARVPSGGLLLVTLTAPGKPGHKRNVGGTLVRAEGAGGKRHTQHEGGDWVRCDCAPDSFDLDDLAAWNARLGVRWNKLVNKRIRRLDPLWWMRGAYFKATEAQHRGALHVHVLVRVRAGVVVTDRMVDELQRAALAEGFGHVLDVEVVESHRAAGYVAKYVSKGSNDRPDVPWSREHATFGRLRTTATYRTWTASRDWPWTMRGLVADRVHYATLLAGLSRWPAVVDADPLWWRGAPTRPDWRPVEGVDVDPATGVLLEAS